MEERWRIELLRTFLNISEQRKKGDKTIHLIISQESESGLMLKLSEVICIKENDRHTRKQIVEQNLKIIEI